jgi:DNA-binding winged helix-turn-helix (wHTH) protein
MQADGGPEAGKGYRFDRFVLDPADRRLTCDGAPVALNARYLDALTLLVREEGRLVSKDRFLEEVWRGVPVTDEALTQAIKALRKALGDDAARPRFIETTPKHGYRFIGRLEAATPEAPPAPAPPQAYPWREVLRLTGAGTLGGGLAGLIGGLIYGFVESSQPGLGGSSMMAVLVSLCVVVAVTGAAGVSLGLAAAQVMRGRHWLWSIVGGAVGGMVVGATVKMVGLDAFNLLFGHAPSDLTGASEGLLLGAAVGLGVGVSGPGSSFRRNVVLAGVAATAVGAAIPSLGGHLMGGSLALLADGFPQSRLGLSHWGRLFGEAGFGPITQSVTGALEGGLFGACVVGAMLLARDAAAG